MKVTVVAADCRKWPKYRWVCQALSVLGHSFTMATTLEDVERADSESDLLIFGQRNAGVSTAGLLALSRRRSGKSSWVQWWFDLVLRENKPLAECESLRADTYGDLMRAMDLVFVKERGLVGEYQRLGINAKWQDQGCPSWIGSVEQAKEGIPSTKTGVVDHEFDVLCIGTVSSEFYRQRYLDVECLAKSGLRVGWVGSVGRGRPIPASVTALPFTKTEDLPALASRAAVVLDVQARFDIDGYVSDRLYIACGMGATVVRRRSLGQPWGPFESYDNHEDMVRVIRELIQEPERRAQLGREARKWVMENHTYEHNSRAVLAACNAVCGKSWHLDQSPNHEDGVCSAVAMEG